MLAVNMADVISVIIVFKGPFNIRLILKSAPSPNTSHEIDLIRFFSADFSFLVKNITTSAATKSVTIAVS